MAHQLLTNIGRLDLPLARSFLLAIRLYHAATALLYSYPEQAYLLHVSAVEAIANLDMKDFRPTDAEIDAVLGSQHGAWRRVVNEIVPAIGDEEMRRVRELLAKPQQFLKKKFCAFIAEYLPDSFWIEREDACPIDFRERQALDLDRYRLNPETLPKVLGKIYDSRSDYLHSGTRFPAYISIGLTGDVISTRSFLEFIRYFPKNEQAIIPPLLIFERLVSFALIGFLSSQSSD